MTPNIDLRFEPVAPSNFHPVQQFFQATSKFLEDRLRFMATFGTGHLLAGGSVLNQPLQGLCFKPSINEPAAIFP